jgi:hypothetical protein
VNPTIVVAIIGFVGTPVGIKSRFPKYWTMLLRIETDAEWIAVNSP